MSEHVHGCLNCRPEMVPDFSRDDPRYHDGEKSGHDWAALVDGVDVGYTRGVFEGSEGWALVAGPGYDIERVHHCPNCTTYRVLDDGYEVFDEHQVCVEPCFGVVTIIERSGVTV